MTASRGLLSGLFVAVVLVGGAWRLLGTTDPRRGFEFAPDMVRTSAAKSLSANSVLPGGLTNQPLVSGVVVRGGGDFEYGTGPEEAARAGRELANPFAASDAMALERGQTVFRIYCTACHGSDGETPPPVVLRGMIPPPSLKAARALGIRDGEILHIVTRGQGNMPSYAAQIGADDRWRVVLALRALQKAERK